MKKIKSISSFIIGICILGYDIYQGSKTEFTFNSGDLRTGVLGYILEREFLALLIIGIGFVCYGLFYARIKKDIFGDSGSDK
ncbi:MAG: hypothetical protein AB1427_21140 [Thermodesulfobacteriota bacterium]